MITETEIKIEIETLKGLPIVVTIKNREIKMIELPTLQISIYDVYPTLMVEQEINNNDDSESFYTIGGSRYFSISKSYALMLLSAMSN